MMDRASRAPAGGFGARAPDPDAEPARPEVPRPKDHVWILIAGGLVIAAIVAGVVVVRHYVDEMRTTEARFQLGRIAAGAVAAYSRDRRVCPSATARVPSEMPRTCDGPMTGIYQSSRADWRVDAKRNAGFACVGFEMTSPQYYQYEYVATDESFTAYARSCVPDMGAFEITGRLAEGGMKVSNVRRIEVD